ncbi:MAG: hypothetical protein EP344_18395, partial [Bacteroidetes bacterium]
MKIPALLFAVSLLLLSSTCLTAQNDDLLAELEQASPSNSIVMATFKGTRLINFQTLEVPGRRT